MIESLRDRRPLERARQAHGSLLVAIALHVPIALVVLHALAPSRYVGWWSSPPVERDVPLQRLRYVTLPPAPTIPPIIHSPPPTQAPHATTDDRPLASGPTAPTPGPTRVVLPTDIAEAGVIGADSTGGAIVSLVPRRADARIWDTRSTYEPPAPTRATQLEASLARGVGAGNDSIAALGVQTIRPEWIATRNGQPYGINDRVIHLGKVSLPAALVGLLPIAGFGCVPTMYLPDRPVRDSIGMTCAQLRNPKLDQRAKRVDDMHAETRARAVAGLAAREEITRIAARMDRERARRLRAQNGAAGPPTSTPPDQSTR